MSGLTAGYRNLVKYLGILLGKVLLSCRQRFESFWKYDGYKL